MLKLHKGSFPALVVTVKGRAITRLPGEHFPLSKIIYFLVLAQTRDCMHEDITCSIYKGGTGARGSAMHCGISLPCWIFPLGPLALSKTIFTWCRRRQKVGMRRKVCKMTFIIGLVLRCLVTKSLNMRPGWRRLELKSWGKWKCFTVCESYLQMHSFSIHCM